MNDNINNVTEKINFPDSYVQVENNQANIIEAQKSGEAFTKEQIESGDLVVDNKSDLQVTSQWIEQIKKNIDADYDVVADGAEIVLINKSDVNLRAGGGVTKIVSTWKGFDLYLKDSHAKNVSDAQQIAGIIAPIVGGALGAVLGGLAAASSVVINRVNRGNGVIIAFLGKQLNPPPIIHWIGAQ